jgi:hypothetical protein
MAKTDRPSPQLLELLHYLEDLYGFTRSYPKTTSDAAKLLWFFIKRLRGIEAKWPVPQIYGRNVSTGPGPPAPVVPTVDSLQAFGFPPLTGAVILAPGTGISLGQVGQTITITGTGGRQKLFDSTLGASAASIDTGAGGIATTYDLLEVYLFLRTDEAVVASAVDIILNDDATAIYDLQYSRAVNATLTGASVVAGTSWNIAAAGASQQAGSFAVFCMSLPTYAQTTAHKAGTLHHGWADSTAANNRVQVSTVRYRSTTAVSRLKVSAPAGKNLIAGSRVLIYGT